MACAIQTALSHPRIRRHDSAIAASNMKSAAMVVANTTVAVKATEIADIAVADTPYPAATAPTSMCATVAAIRRAWCRGASRTDPKITIVSRLTARRREPAGRFVLSSGTPDVSRQPLPVALQYDR